MTEAYYAATFIASLLFMMLYMYIWHKHFDVHITLVFVLVPTNNYAMLMLARSQSVEEAVLAQKLTYISGCYLPLIILLAILSLCGIELRRWVRVMLYGASTVIFVSAQTIGSATIFYKGFDFKRENDAGMIYNKDYGFMHTLFYALVVFYIVVSIFVIIYSYFKKNQVSRKMLHMLLLPEIFSAVAFFGGRRIIAQIELLPIAYDLALAVYLVIIYRISLYNVADIVIDSLVEQGDTGFVSVDYKYNYLGSNETAKNIFPELKKLTVDKPIGREPFIKSHMQRWLTNFVNDEKRSQTYCVRGDKTYLVTIGYLFDGRRKRGYQLVITDDTRNQQYIRLINGFNNQLKIEVEEKTQGIVEMHNKLILGMAAMVESRDNSTGGHIRRTSEGVRLLLDELRKDDSFELTDKFCEDMIKAAPMHDLGKIAVDDAILRKPGRFTPEEFEKMKAHAAEGAKIVHQILDGTDDEEFRRVAENVAHYHHERWDGSGYPEGLKGEEIPFEARIMAIADVYDALVSKRVYKEAMSFDKADAIIMEGMGTQFDRQLEACYVNARPKLEAYYSSIAAEAQ